MTRDAGRGGVRVTTSCGAASAPGPSPPGPSALRPLQGEAAMAGPEAVGTAAAAAPAPG